MYKANFSWDTLLSHFPTINNTIFEPKELANQNTIIEINRGENLELNFKIETENMRISYDFFEGEREDGEVYYNDSEIKIIDKDTASESKLTSLNLRSPNSLEFSTSGHIPNKNTFSGVVTRIDTTLSSLEASQSIDWVVNLEFDEVMKKNCRTNFFTDHIDFEFEPFNNSEEYQSLYRTLRSCFCLDISGIKIFIGLIKKGLCEVDSKFKPGFIYYSGEVTEDFKNKLIESLSFLLGRKLIKIGSADFTSDNTLVKTSAMTPYMVSDSIFKLPSNPPVSFITLNEFNHNGFDYPFMESFIEKIICAYDSHNLKHVFWMYWHAVHSPIHVRAGSFGAIIEFLIAGIDIKKNLIDKNLFEKFRDQTKINFREFCVINNIRDEEAIKIFMTKIEGLNSLPISKTTEKAFIQIGLVSSKFEKKLWQRRHDSAHGNLGDGDFIKLVRDVNAFLSICNRTILKILDLSTSYIDYYSHGSPSKSIDMPLEDEISNK
ncbi:hypothetical protein KTI94_09540 [Acinetobacter baumannii]|nr:hypothetical protein [Acinetobacter baumannii]